MQQMALCLIFQRTMHIHICIHSFVFYKNIVFEVFVHFSIFWLNQQWSYYVSFYSSLHRGQPVQDSARLIPAGYGGPSQMQSKKEKANTEEWRDQAIEAVIRKGNLAYSGTTTDLSPSNDTSSFNQREPNTHHDEQQFLWIVCWSWKALIFSFLYDQTHPS